MFNAAQGHSGVYPGNTRHKAKYNLDRKPVNYRASGRHGHKLLYNQRQLKIELSFWEA